MGGSHSIGLDGEPVLRVPKRAPSQSAAMLRPAALGFVAGVLCWHMIGFWGFVNEAVFFRRGEPVSQVRATAAMAKAQSRQSEAAAPVTNCTAGHISGDKGDTVVASCDGALKFHPSRNILRTDRGDFGPVPVPVLISGEGAAEPAVAAWSARIDTRGE